MTSRGSTQSVQETPASRDAPIGSPALLSTIVDSAEDMIWSVDPAGFGLSMFNRALREYFLNENRLAIEIGMRPEEMLPPPAARQWRELYGRALRDGAFTEEYRVGSGRRVLNLVVTPLARGGETVGIAVFAKDVTRRKHSEEALKKRFRFERLLADLSSRFANLPAGRVDREIEDGLGRIREFLEVDRAALLEIDPDRGQVRLTHLSRLESLSEAFPIDTEMVPLFPWLYEHIVVQGKSFCANSNQDLPPEAQKDAESNRQIGIEAFLSLPISVGGAPTHVIHVDCAMPRNWPEEYIPRLRIIGEVFANALARERSDETRRQTLREIKELKERLRVEAEYLRSEIELSQGQGEIVGKTEAILQVLKQARQVGPTDSHVLITGETGTGKELVARAIHGLSRLKDRPMITVNCATLPPTLIESELFGREKGAYTGALTRQIGRFELADKGTIFLDEIGELPLDLQSKLLRVLQDGEFERLGGPARTIRVKVRVIAATNRDLAEAVRKGDFRKDLYYRLSVFPIHVPPLRERVDDIPLLAWAFVDEFGSKMGKKIDSIAQKSMEMLKRRPWPGNVRELRNTIERAMILSRGSALNIQFPADLQPADAPPMTLEQVESRHIRETLQKTGWRIKGPGGAAGLLGVKPSTLYSKMKKLGIKPRPA
ncbi:MAG: sigma 54-interacting transcriptional regulator [Candidatus Sumerlaeia bacterium]